MLKEAKAKTNDVEEQPKLPLLRLRIIHTDEKYLFHASRFNAKYKDRVTS